MHSWWADATYNITINIGTYNNMLVAYATYNTMLNSEYTIMFNTCISIRTLQSMAAHDSLIHG